MAFNNEIEEVKAQIKVLEAKLSLLEEIEKQPRMNLQQEGEYAVVSYHDKVYYRLEGETTFSWYIKKGVSVTYPVPNLVMVGDADTERLLEGLYYNHIQVKKEKEQQTKSPVEEAYKDWWGQYPELETDGDFDVTRWHGFQAGYEFAWAIAHAKKVVEKVQEEQEDTVWKSVALRFGEKLSDVGPDGYYELSPDAWFRWAVFTYGKGQQVKELVKESVKWCEEHPDKDPLDWLKPQTPEQVADGLKEAFRGAVKQGVVSSSTKPQTLTDLIADWWADVFTTGSDWDGEICIDNLVEQIKHWLPKEQSASGSQNAYVECSVEGYNDCINKIRRKLR